MGANPTPYEQHDVYVMSAGKQAQRALRIPHINPDLQPTNILLYWQFMLFVNLVIKELVLIVMES